MVKLTTEDSLKEKLKGQKPSISLGRAVNEKLTKISPTSNRFIKELVGWNV